jgi:hypothetical protein
MAANAAFMIQPEVAAPSKALRVSALMAGVHAHTPREILLLLINTIVMRQ